MKAQRMAKGAPAFRAELDEANAQMVAVTLRTAAAKHKEASHG